MSSKSLSIAAEERPKMRFQAVPASPPSPGGGSADYCTAKTPTRSALIAKAARAKSRGARISHAERLKIAIGNFN